MKGFWRGRGGAAKMDLYMRITLYGIPWFLFLGVIGPLVAGLARGDGPPWVGEGLLAVAFALNVLSMHAVSRGMAHHRHGDPAPRRTAVVALALGVAFTALAVTYQLTGGFGAAGKDGADLTLVMMLGLTPVAMCAFTLSTVGRLTLATFAAAVLSGLAVQVITGNDPVAVITVVAILLAGLYGLAAFRSSLWFVSTVWELDRARDTEARLAVAEERLRFGRDLHDVMGRNLAVIALKSELAVQLAERGRPEAVAQMAEVQRIAQESQREVRAVVRGYREADLRNEIEGARGVLAAAGISCVVEDGLAADLSAGVQSALGWVVRETTTNVLRHGNPKSCTLRLTSDGVRAVLVVENDGANGEAAVGPSGSGMAGLRERLAAVGGTLVAGAEENGLFRVRAEVPLTAPDDTDTRTDKEAEGMTPQASTPRTGTARFLGRLGTRAGAA
ncbi:histidine kinase [Streptomyces spiroverticillatus]|uniref:Histidine kinase n=1 Tax=Streptomyces finlayi TaxID=67296 RepID=A0A918WUT1_9ACTN|nr:sensor histidine kinase [Streptomyces finlayi]GHA00468.1 histidine kinase [Streptomyces spiroverticillatus]GHC84935.1 histidine kinase [Streptomyces finlayi]